MTPPASPSWRPSWWARLTPTGATISTVAALLRKGVAAIAIAISTTIVIVTATVLPCNTAAAARRGAVVKVCATAVPSRARTELARGSLKRDAERRT